MARGRSRSGPSMSSRARERGQQPSHIGLPGSERGERLLEQRDHVRTRRFGHRGHAVQAERGACQHRGVAGSAGAPGSGEERGPCVLTVPRPAQRVAVFAQQSGAGGREAAGEVDGAAKMTGALVEGHPGGRLPTRLDKRGQCPAPVSQRQRHRAVVGDLRRRGRDVRITFQQFCHGEVQRRPPRGRQPLVEDFTEQVVAEAAAARRVLLDDARADRAIQQRHRILGRQSDDARHGRDREPLTRHGGDGEQVHHLTGQARQAAGEHVTDRARHPGNQGVVERRALCGEQPRGLLHEERVAAGALVHRGGQRGRRPFPADLVQELAYLAGGQPGQRQQTGLAGQLGEQPAGRMLVKHHLHVPVGPDHQRGAVAELAGQEQQQP